MNTIEITKKESKADFARLRSVIACLSKDPTRAVINLLLVEKAQDGVIITATDGRRLRSDNFDFQVEAGLYEVKTCNAKSIFMVQSSEKSAYPNYEQIIPPHGEHSAYTLNGQGKMFVLWAASALGCYLDPKLVEVGEDEEVSLFIQKKSPHLSPALVRNKTTTFVLMPISTHWPWAYEIERIKSEIAKHREEEKKAA